MLKLLIKNAHITKWLNKSDFGLKINDSLYI